MFERLPLIILAGSDQRRSAVPDELHANDMLDGPKGVRLLRTGRCLVDELVDRARRSECFSDIVLVGPRQMYQDKVSCDIVDVEGNLVRTLERVMETIQDRFDISKPVALSSCDILPSVDDFRTLLSESYGPRSNCQFWWQLIEASATQLGASRWKPAYHLPEAAGESEKRLYPGHVVIVRPEALRLRLANRLLQLAYQYRNRLLRKRFLGITLRMLGTLVAEDMRNLKSGQLPTLTFSVPYFGLSAYFKYQRRHLTVRDFEQAVSHVFLHRAFQQGDDGRPVVCSISPLVSFAKDIDTVAEFEEADRAASTGE